MIRNTARKRRFAEIILPVKNYHGLIYEYRIYTLANDD